MGADQFPAVIGDVSKTSRAKRDDAGKKTKTLQRRTHARPSFIVPPSVLTVASRGSNFKPAERAARDRKPKGYQPGVFLLRRARMNLHPRWSTGEKARPERPGRFEDTQNPNGTLRKKSTREWFRGR